MREEQISWDPTFQNQFFRVNVNVTPGMSENGIDYFNSSYNTSGIFNSPMSSFMSLWFSLKNIYVSKEWKQSFGNWKDELAFVFTVAKKKMKKKKMELS